VTSEGIFAEEWKLLKEKIKNITRFCEKHELEPGELSKYRENFKKIFNDITFDISIWNHFLVFGLSVNSKCSNGIFFCSNL